MGPGPAPAPLTRWQQTWRLVLAALIGAAGWVVVWVVLPTTITGEWRVLSVIDLLVLPVTVWLATHRRTRPVLIASVLAVLTAVFSSASGAALLALFSLAARRHLQGLLLVLPLTVGASIFHSRVVTGPLDPNPPHPIGELVSTATLTLTFAAIAYAIGSRRAVKQAAEERLAAALREQEARVAQAQAAERTRIAREMHDVLAHRISLVAMHASALNYRQDLSDDERRTAAETIERNARDALTELREILGVLRDPAFTRGDTDRPEAPQPTLADLPALVAETRTLGAQVTLSDDSGEVAERTARAAYRIVQEALTNARKHAPGAPVRITVTGGDGQDLTVRVSQPQRDGADAPPGSGLGLLGLRERAALVGGTLEAGPDGAGQWVVSARLPDPDTVTP